MNLYKLKLDLRKQDYKALLIGRQRDLLGKIYLLVGPRPNSLVSFKAHQLKYNFGPIITVQGPRV